jgi:HSP20 family protein
MKTNNQKGGEKCMTRSLTPLAGEIDRFLNDSFFLPSQNFLPAIDIYQETDNVIAEVALPGIDPKEVDITIENDVLSISGERKSEREVKREDYYCKEVRGGSFSRSLVLPMSVKGDEAKAKYENGMLRITMPKQESVKPKRISVDVS